VTATLSEHEKLFADGSVLVTEATGLPEWAALRVSFLKPSVASATSSAAPKSATGVDGDLASLGLSRDPSVSFSIDDMDDELVALPCALAAALRAESVLAEAVWPAAIDAARSALALQREETQRPHPMSMSRSPATASARSRAEEVGDSAELSLSKDVVSAVSASWRAEREAALFDMLAAYESRAKADEAVGACIAEALAPAFATLGTDPRSPFSAPPLSELPLEDASILEHDASEGGADEGALTAAPAPPILPAPEGLTVTDDLLRRIYMLASLSARRLAHAFALASAVSEHSADVDVALRARRKLTHVGLRCGVAWFSAVHLASVAATAPPPRPAAASALAALAGGAAPVPDAAAAHRETLCAVFGLPRDEAPVLAIPARGGTVSGTLLATKAHVLFHASLMGFVTKIAMPLGTLIAATPSSGSLADAVSLTYVDSKKVAALAKRDAEATAARSFPRPPPSALADAPRKQLSPDDLFAAIVGGGDAPAAAPEEEAVPVRRTPAQPTPAAAAAVSIDDAFTGLGIFEGVGDASEGLPDNKATAAVSAPAAVSSRPAASSSTAVTPAILKGLSNADLSIFFASGATAEALDVLSVAPLSAKPSRDSVYCLIQLLRQVDGRPHVHHFDFSVAGTGLPAGAGQSLPSLNVPDMMSWAAARGASKPALLLPNAAKPQTAANGLANRAGDDMLDLFSTAPSAPPGELSSISNAYGDLGGLDAAGDL
jgi:hypothetical protein